MVEQTIKVALPIFKYAFPDCEELWLFYNATNHNSYSSNSLVAYKMSKGPGGKQPKMREGLTIPEVLSLWFPDNHPDHKLRGEAKGIEHVLQERCL
jgi:hypothetical protein